jgi:uncharacterized protein YjbI with pentapeptide repeats
MTPRKVKWLTWLVGAIVTIVVLPLVFFLAQRYFILSDKISERMTLDVKYLGDSAAAVRQLALSDLRQLARKDGAHSDEICNALSAFVRKPSDNGRSYDPTSADSQDLNSAISTISILSEKGQCRNINLKYANLQGLELRNGSLIGADFTGAHLEDAILDGTNVTNANFTATHLLRIDLHDAIAAHVQLTGSDIEQADFRCAVLDYTTGVTAAKNVSSARFEGASLRNVNLGRYQYRANRRTEEVCKSR